MDPDPKSDPIEAGHAANGDGKWTSLVIGSESQNESQSEEHTQAQTQTEPSTTPIASPGSRKSVRWSPELVTESPAMSYPSGSSPYVSSSPVPSSSFSLKGKVFSVSIFICLRTSFGIEWNFCMIFFGADTVGTVRNVLGRWGKKVGEATRKAEDLAGNTWQHRKFFRFFQIRCYKDVAL